MSRLLWLNWSGGGNLPPSLGIARALTERGHAVTFAGRPEMVPRVEAAGFQAIEYKQAYAQVDRYPQGHPLTRAACYLTSPAVEEETREIVAAQKPDAMLIDAMFPAALAQRPGFERPSALICHTFIFRQHEMWRKMIANLNGMRQQAGFASLPSMDELWLAMDRIVCTALASFDSSPLPGWESVHHVGPVLEDEKVAVQASLPWPETDSTPLVLVSFSTGFEQRSVDKIQRTLDALGELPVHVVATTGGIVEPSELRVPGNAVALNYAAHDPILRRAALAITHGGHGTAMRSLRHGVPMILMPGLAADQPFIAAQMQEWGVGRALPGDAEVGAIKAAAEDILAQPSYRKRAQQRATALAAVDGANAAADELEEMAGGAATQTMRPVSLSSASVFAGA
jgi:UDP:flavonoid glycosyltransferase YjiC (YdhE family)